MHRNSMQYLFGGNEPRPVRRGGEVTQILQPLHRQKGQSLTTFCWGVTVAVTDTYDGGVE